MSETLKTYWNGDSEHQDKLRKLSALTPSWGMTENKYVNLFITACNVYYDVYNNNGWNIKENNFPERVLAYLLPFKDDLKALRFDVKEETLLRNFKNEKKLERFMDEIVLYLQDKDLSYEKHTIYFDNDKKELSKTEIEGFIVITFGLQAEYDDWVNHRMNAWKFQMVE